MMNDNDITDQKIQILLQLQSRQYDSALESLNKLDAFLSSDYTTLTDTASRMTNKKDQTTIHQLLKYVNERISQLSVETEGDEDEESGDDLTDTDEGYEGNDESQSDDGDE